MPREVAEAWHFYAMIRSGIFAPVSPEWLDAQPAQFGADLAMIISVISEASGEAK